MSLSPIPTSVRKKVNDRSRMRCEWCGGWGEELHHRQGGSVRKYRHQVENIVRLCSGDHRLITEFSVNIRGFSIYANDTPAEAPLLLIGQLWVTLTPDGTYRAGSLEMRNLGDVQDLLTAVRIHRVGPTDSRTRFEPPVPAAGVVVDGGLGQPRSGLLDPVRGARVEAGSLVFGAEDVREVLPYLAERLQAEYGVGDSPQSVRDF